MQLAPDHRKGRRRSGAAYLRRHGAGVGPSADGFAGIDHLRPIDGTLDDQSLLALDKIRHDWSLFGGAGGGV